METESRERQETSALLDTVALLSDMPTHGLARGQVGTVVEALDQETLLVEFSDDEGRAYAIASCPRDANGSSCGVIARSCGILTWLDNAGGCEAELNPAGCEGQGG